MTVKNQDFTVMFLFRAKICSHLKIWFQKLTIAWKFDTIVQSRISTQLHHESSQLAFAQRSVPWQRSILRGKEQQGFWKINGQSNTIPFSDNYIYGFLICYNQARAQGKMIVSLADSSRIQVKEQFSKVVPNKLSIITNTRVPSRCAPGRQRPL